MERKRTQNPPLDDETIDRYLHGEMSEEQEESVEQAISASRQAAQILMRKANIAARLALLNPAAHGQAYRREAFRQAVARLRETKPGWKERIDRWFQSLSLGPVLFREMAWGTRSAVDEEEPRERRLRLSPADNNVRITVEKGDSPVTLDLKGWPTAPLIVLTAYRGQAKLKEQVFESVRAGGTEEEPIFQQTLGELEADQYLISVEPAG